MNQQRKDSYTAVVHRIDRVRRLYSQIGQPLPADIIIDLHHYLDSALELKEREDFPRKPRRTGRPQA